MIITFTPLKKNETKQGSYLRNAFMFYNNFHTLMKRRKRNEKKISETPGAI